MVGGLFITLYDEITLQLYLKHGIYGFLMKPVFEQQPSSRSKHYAALADYACSREGSHVFFFLKRRIVYGGVVKGSSDFASFYLNGDTSPLGRKANAPLFWDESQRYHPTDKDGVFNVKGIPKSQPYILLFDAVAGLTGNFVSSDDLYFELGRYPYPLPSNTIEGMSFCTLTPGETETALNLCKNSDGSYFTDNNETMAVGTDKVLFNPEMMDWNSYISESHLEFTLLANIEPLKDFLSDDSYVICRQVPISPFKPAQHIDRADICLYSVSRPIANGTIPNAIIELKKERANFHAYNQMLRYLKWLKKICDPADFQEIIPLIIAPSFYIKRAKIDDFIDKIVMYALDTGDVYTLLD